MRFNDEREIEAIVASFEDATIVREVWKHAEHLTVAFYYLNSHDTVTATAKMRDGIFNLLRNGFKVDLSKEMPYHETLTVFWMLTVEDFNAGRSGAPLLERTNELIDAFDKDYPLKFYSRELLFSDRARGEFVEPDLAPFRKAAQAGGESTAA